MKTIRIGSGAGYAGDRLEPSLELIEKGSLNYIVYECLAERTIAIGQQAKLKDSSKGYNDMLEYRMSKALPLCRKHNVTLITNMGAANPEAAAARCAEIARELGLSGIKIACVTGDDLMPQIDKYMDTKVWETRKPLMDLPGEIISANVYMGVDGILDALEQGANVIITGRVADPSMFLAPIIHEFGWERDDWDKLGMGTMMGHLLECGGQVTGGYFADPGKKDVPNLSSLGFPIAEISGDASFVITKVRDAGGMVTRRTCAEQICYEIHDPENYLTPDVVADFKLVSFEEPEKDTVRAMGARGKPKPDTLKCSVGYRDCYIGEGEISYGGPGCVDRGRLALEILKDRLELTASGRFDELKFDLIGCDSLYWDNGGKHEGAPGEVRVRLAGRAKDKETADLIGSEVESLYTNGPAGGGGAIKRTREIVSVASILVDRGDALPSVRIYTEGVDEQ